MIGFKLIHMDTRGIIACFYEDNVEYTLLTTKQGYARGGCIHKINKENFVILKGMVEYHIFYPSEEVIKIYGKGESGLIPNGIPHYLIALDDSLTLEWGATPEEKDCKDPAMRKIVIAINEYAKSLRQRK